MTASIENENIAGRKKPNVVLAIIFLVVVLAIAAAAIIILKTGKKFPAFRENKAVTGEKTFEENFQKKEDINETAKMSESSNSDWWVNSGGLMMTEDGIGKSIQGDLSPDSEWYGKYRRNNPEDTDGGLHPQNIFRLVARGKWGNLSQEAYFRIRKLNLSESPNRNGSNGLLLFNRYQDGDELYYTGLRVDGSAIIKKKYAGKYYTLKETEFFQGEKYDRDENPNLLPLGKWIGLKSELVNTAQGDVEIRLYVDDGKNGNWKLAASAVDDGRKEFGKNIISDEGHAGIRTDFMDVEFSGYKIYEIK